MTHVPPIPYCVISSPSSFLPAWLAQESKASIDKTAKEEFALFRERTKEWSQDVSLARKQSNARWICVYYKPNLPLMVCEAMKQPTGSAVTCFTKESPIKQIIVPINDKDVLWKTTAQNPPKHYH